MQITQPDLSKLTNRGLPIEQLDAGEKVFMVNDTGDCLYVVLSGSIEVITLGNSLEVVETGGIFGEVALIDAGSRSASAMAATNAEVVRIDRPAFLDLVHDHPTFALSVMSALAARIRRASAAQAD